MLEVERAGLIFCYSQYWEEPEELERDSWLGVWTFPSIKIENLSFPCNKNRKFLKLGIVLSGLKSLITFPEGPFTLFFTISWIFVQWCQMATVFLISVNYDKILWHFLSCCSSSKSIPTFLHTHSISCILLLLTRGRSLVMKEKLTSVGSRGMASFIFFWINSLDFWYT